MTGLAVALAAVYWATPVAIRVAERFEFFDKPVGYKGHAAPTPYLGGAAVVAGFVVAAGLLTADWSRTLPLLGGVLVLWVVGTIDDRRNVSPLARVAVEITLAVMLWSLDLGWTLESGAAVDLALTIVWVVAVVNAFNLFDNMDGAASTMALVVAAGAAVLGVVIGDVWLSVVAVALCGACLGFLPHNLASPARIFLGDGGSMPVGFAAAALVMIGASAAAPEWQALFIGLLLVGIPALDTCFVVISRTRRGISILTGGRDHLTHRTHQRLRTARAVAVALGGAQALISVLAIVAIEGGSSVLVGATILYLVGFGSTIALLDAPVTLAPAAADTPAPAAEAEVGGHRMRLAPPRRWLLGALGLVIGLGPLSGGYYDSSIWVPAGLALVVIVTAGLIARPPRLSRAGAMAAAGLAGLALWALISASWAESIEQAVAEANRYAVYAALFGVLLVLIRDRIDATWLLGSVAMAGVVVAGVVLAEMLGSAPADVFLLGRLNEPLGYINGQASFFLLALFPCLALAERRNPLAAGCGLLLVTVLASLTLLTQSRGAAVALLAAVVVVLAVAPGRVRRGWAVVVAGVAVTLAGPALLEVYEVAQGGELTGATVRAAARAILLAGLGAGFAWALAVAVSARLVGWARLPVARAARGGVLAAGVIAVLVAGALDADRVADTARTQYRAFTLQAEPPPTIESEPATTRLVSGSGNRYDYWRVAYDAWRERPVLGVGAGNYDRPYFADRSTPEDVRQPHSIELQALSELGIAGAALVLLMVGGVAAGIGRCVRPARAGGAARTSLVAGAGMTVAWLVHTSVDWMHLLPGLTGMALVGLAVLVPSGKEIRRVRPHIAIAIPLAVAVALAGISLTRQGLAEHFRRAAQADLAVRPADALENANRSLRLDPEAVGTYYVKAAAFARYAEVEAARATLREAAEKEPSDFVTWTLLGDLAVREGRLEDARALYGRASALNPRDVGLRELQRDPAGGLR